MHYTIFNTPVVKHIFRGFSLLFMKALGWRTEGALPDIPRYVLIVAPHTSNWDLLFGAVTAFALRLDVYFMAKHQLFRFPFGPLMKWIGALRIDRRVHADTVKHAVETFREHERLVIAVPPEGTRAKVKHWKTGFYYIAAGAGVPVVMAFIDYGRKTAGVGPVITPYGDIDADMGAIRKFYDGISGRYREKTSEAALPVHVDAGRGIVPSSHAFTVTPSRTRRRVKGQLRKRRRGI
ncbi:MAG: lysophospholipid acyltransferase family protein [Spirochaetes bacterium]|nr:lysophospholipid acyltransferase family protein [Spirochaetota bacterium]